MALELGNIEYVDMGNFAAGEIPAPLAYTFLDGNSNTITELDEGGGATIRLDVSKDGGVAAAATGAVSLASGVATYLFVAADMQDPGHYEAQFWASKGQQIYASYVIRWYVYDGVGPTA